MIENKQLTTHFDIYTLTKTSHVALQDQNRMLSEDQAKKLGRVAELLEEVQIILEVPLVVTSGYRCPELNMKLGSSLRSQHLLCEAADSIPKGLPVDEAFRKLRHAIKDGKVKMGQLIWEKTGGREGSVEWLHISLGYPYREKYRCGQILTMVDGKYTLIETVS